ncbi:MAG TPA: response regulator transcription factor [Anaerolineae bacterium]|nr:response regulator transcription factor [Anaerolineae bacterium]
MPYQTLIIEDTPKTANLLRLYFEREGHQVTVAHDGLIGLNLARQQPPDLLLLDLMLPQIDGQDICRLLRAEPDTKDIPIIMITAKSTEDDLLHGLDLGADDYITKPFSPRELLARARALLRRAHPAPTPPPNPSRLSFGPLTIDEERHEIYYHNQLIPITPKEFKILTTFAHNPHRAFTRQELLDEAFGFMHDALPRTADVHILNLRKKLDLDPQSPTWIETVYGHGYKFVPPDNTGTD